SPPLWACTIDAPASNAASASAAISAGSMGTCGLTSLVVAPLMAASMITGVDIARAPAASLAVGCLCSTPRPPAAVPPTVLRWGQLGGGSGPVRGAGDGASARGRDVPRRG